MTDTKQTTTLALSPSSLTEALAFAAQIKGSKLLPAHYKDDAASIAVQMITGMELGFTPMASLRAIHVINGRPGMSAEAIAAMVQNSPKCEYLMLTESSATKATYETKRAGHPKPITMSFTIEQAKAMGLTGKDNWKDPTHMLRHRCVTAICRAAYSDVLLGMSSVAEIEDEVWLERSKSEQVRVDPSPEIVSAVRGDSPKPKPSPSDATWTEPPSSAPPVNDAPKAELTAAEAVEQKYAVALREASGLDALNMVAMGIKKDIEDADAKKRLLAVYNESLARLKAGAP